MITNTMLRSLDEEDYNLGSEEDSKEINMPRKIKLKKKSSKDAT
jgi:hypothetical protein